MDGWILCVCGNIWTKSFFALFFVGNVACIVLLVPQCGRIFFGVPNFWTNPHCWVISVSYYTDITNNIRLLIPPILLEKIIEIILNKSKITVFWWILDGFFWCLTPHVAPLVAKSRSSLSSFLARWLAPQWGGAQLLKQHAAFPVVSPEQLQSLASRGKSVEIPWRKRAFQWEYTGNSMENHQNPGDSTSG